MRKSSFLLLIVLPIMACDRQSDHSWSERNTEFTSAVLDRYAPRARFGNDIAHTAIGDTIIEVDTGSVAHSVTWHLANDRDGISRVRVHGESTPDGLKASKFTFYMVTEAPDTSYQTISAAIDSLFGAPGQRGCAQTQYSPVKEHVILWESPDGGGAALITWINAGDSPVGGARLRLVVFPEGMGAGNAIAGLRRRACDDR
jgi:hypothetical protein